MTVVLGKILFTTIITYAAYLAGLKIYEKSMRKSWLNPLYTVSLFLVCFLPILHVDYQRYQEGVDLFSFLMQTAIVSLAIPLFKQWQLLKRNLKKIGIAIVSGSLAGLTTTLALAGLFKINAEMLASLTPKAATLPIALSVSDKIGGEASLTVLFVLSSAVFSFICGPKVLQLFNITSKAARGLAMGASAQALGASKCLQWGEEEGAMGSIGMTTTAIFISVLIPAAILLM
ncbi:LrgB family protein [Bacillus sp. Marseille-Q3570]|uniref:LrgB family protein n=1 Tax=Bacillus sp. Marseille-Q3570 TaxID=2963522 RepID=UPI0021B78592|nr:LrgB family protein [Bacillus sp. Marseille-Q3570]